MKRTISTAILLCTILLVPLAQAAPIQGPNGNFYERVDVTLLWTNARDAAALRTFQGQSGFLATILDADTQAFLFQNLRVGAPADCWFGGTDEAVEGEWRWLTGELFWLGDENGSVQNSLYENWNSGEPNDGAGGGTEEGVEMRSDGTWNDLFNTSTNGCYFVEYLGVVRAVPISPAAMILTVLLLGALGVRRLAKHA